MVVEAAFPDRYCTPGYEVIEAREIIRRIEPRGVVRMHTRCVPHESLVRLCDRF